MPVPLIAAIIPYFRAPEKLETCLAALNASAGVTIHPIIRDNSEDNIYFTAAINEGLVKAVDRGDCAYALVLNQDAYVEPETVLRLVQHLDARPECGIACPVQIDDDHEIYWAGSLNAFPVGRHSYEPVTADTLPFATYWPNGAAMMLRLSMVRYIGLMDENMMFLGSDADYGFTARSRGWAVEVVPAARIRHGGGTAGVEAPDDLNVIKIRDLIYFGEKWLTGGLFKRLAYEGGKLSALTVKFEMERLQNFLGKHGPDEKRKSYRQRI
jgi:GT2 family glycosyltransferase